MIKYFNSLFAKQQIFFAFLIPCISLFASSLMYCCDKDGAQMPSLFNEIKKNIEIREAYAPLVIYSKAWGTNIESERESQEQAYTGRKDISLVQSEDGEFFIPSEIWMSILLQTISESITTKKDFKAALMDLASIARVKKFNDHLFTDVFKRATIPKLFNSLHPGVIKELNFESLTGNTKDQTICGTIKNIFLKIIQLRKYRTPPGLPVLEKNHYNETNSPIDESLRYLIALGISPNLFICSHNLFHIAINNGLPCLANYLLQSGADSNMRTQNYTEEKKQHPYLLNANYNQIPFVLAFATSPYTALALLRNKNLDIDLIKEKLKECFCLGFYIPSIYKAVYYDIIRELVSKDISPNYGVYGVSSLSTSLFGCVLLMLSEKLVQSGISIEELEEKEIELIKFLLDHEADIDKEYYIYTEGGYQTPRQFAELNKDRFPELVGLFNEHEKSKNN